jgi:signal transduction histidine kinase
LPSAKCITHTKPTGRSPWAFIVWLRDNCSTTPENIAMTSRTLLCLPAITHDARQWRLPLCDATAVALLEALTNSSDPSRATCLCAALAVDPALAVWSVWQAAQVWPTNSLTGQREASDFPRSIASLSAWLSPRLLALLDWHNAPATMEVLTDQQGQFAALVAESSNTAQNVVRSTGLQDVCSEPIYLAALTARWQEWLTASQADQTASVSAWPAWPLETIAAENSISTEARATADEAWRRWLVEIPGIQQILPMLTVQLRRLTDLEQNFQERLQNAKLEALKEFAYGAGHELNNPLANIASRAQTLLKEEAHPERRRRLAAINTQAFRAHEMLADMMLFAHPPQPMCERIDVAALVQEVLVGLAEQAATQQTVLHPPTRIEPLHITADAAQLRVALRAVCMNSLEALHQGGNLTIEICRCDATLGNNEPPGNAVQIVMTDDGPGIPSEIREKIFDPFFSGREAGRGLGFGLSKCWRIVRLHGGRIDVQSILGHGAMFTITLPAAD